MPSGLVRTRRSPGFAPPLRRSRSGWAAPITASPYFGSASRIVWPPARVPPASRTLADAPAKISVSVSPGRSSGNAAIESAKGRGRPSRRRRTRRSPRRSRRRSVGHRRAAGRNRRPDDRELLADTVDSGVVGRVQSGDNSSGPSVAASAPRPESASASRSAPSFAAHPPHSVISVSRRRLGSIAVTLR